MTSDHRNVTNEELFDPHRVATTINVITRSLQEKLRKRKLELPKSEAFLRSIGSATSKGGRKDAKERGEGEMKSVGGGGGTGEGSMQEITEDMQSGNSVGASYTEQSCSSIQSFTEDGTKMAEGDSATCSSEGAQEVVGCEGVGEGVRDGGVRGEDGESDGGRVTGDEGTGVKEGGSSGGEGVGVAKTIGAITDEDLIRLQPSEKRKVSLKKDACTMYIHVHVYVHCTLCAYCDSGL